MSITSYAGMHNFKLVPKNDIKGIKEWIARGFFIEDNCNIYRFLGDISTNYVMTKEAQLFTEADAKNILGKKIEGVNDSFGTYGMGGLGFLGFKFYECGATYWLIIGLDSCDIYITMDGRAFSCSEREKCRKINPWYFGFAHHPEKSRDMFFSYLCTMIIADASYTGKNFSMELKDAYDKHHRIEVSTDYENQVYLIMDGTDLMSSSESLNEY